MRPAVALAIYLVLGALCTSPLLEKSRTHVAGPPGDTVLNASILWWNATNLPFSEHWWNPPYFYPTKGVSAFTENLVGISPIATPLYRLTRNPLTAYNVTLFLTWPLSAMAAYLLARFLTGRDDGAFVAGLAYGFTPYRTAEMGHIQMVASFWIPLALLGLHGYLRSRRPAWLVLFGVTWILQSLANLYLMLYGGVLIALWICFFCSTRESWRAGRTIVVAWVLASLPLLPVLLKYRSIHQDQALSRSLSEYIGYSTPIRAWIEVTGYISTWRHILPDGDDNLFPGVTAVTLVVLGVVFSVRRRRHDRGALARRSVFAFYTLGIVAMGLFTFGPVISAGKAVVFNYAPYYWLLGLPGFDGLRVPSRFWMLGVLCMAIAAGLALVRLPLAGRGARTFVFLMASCGVLLDGWIYEMPMANAPVRWPVVERRDQTQPIIELPLGPAFDAAATYRSIWHRRGVFNGVSGYDPHYYFPLQEGLNDRDPTMLSAIASFGAFDAVVDGAADPRGELTRYVSGFPGVVRFASDGTRTAYRLPAVQPPDERVGPEFPIAAAKAYEHDASMIVDGRPETEWRDDPQTPLQWVSVDLGEVREVGGVSHSLGEFARDFPRRLAIELSVDGVTWERVWEGRTVSHAFRAAVVSPPNAVMRFTFAARPARYVRLRQLAHHTYMWRVAEVQVHGPVK